MIASVRSVVVALVLLTGASIVEAQDCFFTQVRFFAANVVPSGHTAAEGQLLVIPRENIPFSQMTDEEKFAAPLYPLLQQRFGGSATTFALPDLRSRAPIGVGQSPGTSNRTLAETGGVETVTLGVAEMPAHSHVPLGTNDVANDSQPGGNVWAGKMRTRIYGGPTAPGLMSPNALEPAGAGAPVDNMTPFVALKPTLCTSNAFFPTQP
jgi:microcystin-dependent protein